MLYLWNGRRLLPTVLLLFFYIKKEITVNRAVKWSSSNKNVAKVSRKGVVSINKKAGGKSVKITATARDGSGKKAVYTIKVMKGVVKKAAISGNRSIEAGKSLKLNGTVKIRHLGTGYF